MLDVESCVRVLRTAGLSSHALNLCEMRGCHELALRLLLDDLEGYTRAIDYLSDKPVALVCFSLPGDSSPELYCTTTSTILHCTTNLRVQYT